MLIECSAKCYNNIYVSHLGYTHLSPVTPLASTSGETSPASQVLPKGSVVRILLVHFLSIEPWVCPCADTIQIMRIVGQLQLILMDMGHILMTYSTQLIPKNISKMFGLVY
jgi:hypothetical protein